MSGRRVVGVLVAVAMVLGGGYLALAGLGRIGQSGDTSAAWAITGSLLAGLGLALGFTQVQRLAGAEGTTPRARRRRSPRSLDG